MSEDTSASVKIAGEAMRKIILSDKNTKERKNKDKRQPIWWFCHYTLLSDCYIINNV